MVDKSVEIKYNHSYPNIIIGGIRMDRITESFLQTFSQQYGVSSQSIEDQFEHFANYCAIANESNTVDLNLLDMWTGDSTQGIDGIAIQVNGKYVTSIDDVNELLKNGNSLTVNFVFVQAKTAEDFNNSLISNFLTFVQTFFSNDPTAFTTEEMCHFLELKDYIYSKSNLMRQRNPNLRLYYISCGTWNENDNTLKTVIAQHKRQLEQTNLFDSVEFIPFGSREVQAAYRKSISDFEISFTFEKRVTLFSDESDNIGYCGVLPYAEFRKIICTDDGNLRDVFEDNIRDFLGSDNDVNRAIDATLRNGLLSRFSVLNNGITIVADRVTVTGDRVTITNYQVVNGCQTSHVIFAANDIPGIDTLLIPIRLIATNDEDLKNDITRATNNQTSIKKEQLEALSTFQRMLEEYYKTFTEPGETLYYERRTGQYRSKDIPTAQIVSIPLQIKAAAAMFLDNPHDAAGRYGTIAKNVGKKLFCENHKPIIYYVSSLALYRFESLIKQKKIARKNRKARYHAIMLFKYVVGGKDVPKYFNSKKMETYCERIRLALNNSEKCEKTFTRILDFISNHDEINFADRKVFERKETTDILLRSIDEIISYVNAD